jgi:phospholipid N-methyltransferase
MPSPLLLKAGMNFLMLYADASLQGITSLIPEVTYNSNRMYKNGKKAPDGIEIRFGNARPTEKVRELLKQHGFKFSERQKMWYAYDDASTKDFIKEFASAPVEIDDTQYEKLHFWAKIKNDAEYAKLSPYTGFMVRQQYDDETFHYNTKKQLEHYHYPSGLIGVGLLYFKKFYNKVIDGEEAAQPGPEKEESSDHEQVAQKLHSIAEGMTKQVEAKLQPPISKQRLTARRARIAAGIIAEGFKLQELQQFIFSLAASQRTGNIGNFPFLAKIRTKKDAELISSLKDAKKDWMGRLFQNSETTFKKLGINNVQDWEKADEQRRLLMQSSVPAAAQQEKDKKLKIAELERKLLGQKIPGFFPTPLSLIEKMLFVAELQEGDVVLEPSAGKGDILDEIRDHVQGLHLSAIEPNYQLREILKLKGYNLVGSDFLEHHKKDYYNKIIMNPPFENGQDIDHVNHALSLLKDGGKLVAIVSEGPFFRQYKKDQAFRQMLEEQGALVSRPFKEAFKDSFNSTGVTVRIVTIEKKAVADSKAESPKVTKMDMELEIQAEAELEILKLRVELARKKQNGVTLSGLDPAKLQRLEQLAWKRQNQWQVYNFR